MTSQYENKPKTMSQNVFLVAAIDVTQIYNTNINSNENINSKGCSECYSGGNRPRKDTHGLFFNS